MAEAYRSRTYRRRLSLPPVLKTGRHTGDDTPPHNSHIYDTKPGGKQVRPAARRWYRSMVREERFSRLSGAAHCQAGKETYLVPDP